VRETKLLTLEISQHTIIQTSLTRSSTPSTVALSTRLLAAESTPDGQKTVDVVSSLCVRGARSLNRHVDTAKLTSSIGDLARMFEVVQGPGLGKRLSVEHTIEYVAFAIATGRLRQIVVRQPAPTT
jgi:hypothetical protein